MRRLVTLVFVAALVVVMAASFSVSAAGGRVIVMNQQEPNMINPYLDSMQATFDVSQLTWGGMLELDEKWELIPSLALEVPSLQNGGISKDGLTYTWKLRKDVKWSDGAPFTSEDIKFTWEYIMNDNLNVVSRTGFEEITAIETPDKYTVVMKLKQIHVPMLYVWTGPTIVPKHILSKSKNLNEDSFNMNPVGLGPYVLDKWEHGSYLIFKKNPNYWRKGYPKLDQIVYKPIPDENTAFTQLATKEIDVYQTFPTNQYKQVKGLTHVNVTETASTYWEHININCKSPLLTDVRVRQALRYATDLKKLQETVYEGLWPVAVSDQGSPFWKNAKLKPYQFDLKKAGQLLDQAGWKLGNDGMRYKNGKKLTLVISTTAGRIPREMTEQILQQDWKKIGVDLVIKNYDAGKFFATYDEGGILDTGDYDLAVFAWGSSPDPDNYTLWHSAQFPPAGQNNVFWSNKRVDELIITSRKELDVNKRKAMIDEIQQIMWEEVPMIPTFYWVNLDAFNKNIKNIKPNGTSSGNLWNAYEWELK